MADDVQQELTFLDIESSPSFIREPEGNGCAERFIRLLKENLLWVKSLATIEELRQPSSPLSTNTTSSGFYSATTTKPRR